MIIFDNFITQKKHFESISKSPFWEDQSYYWHSMDNLDKGIGSWVVQKILQTSARNFFPFEKACGFEYWPGVISHEDELLDVGIDGENYHLNIHVDKDEILYEETGEFSFPLFGAILYFLEEDIEGGLLRYWVNEHTYQDIECKNNRLIVFDPSCPHGVTQVTKGVRKALSINFWEKELHV